MENLGALITNTTNIHLGIKLTGKGGRTKLLNSVNDISHSF